MTRRRSIRHVQVNRRGGALCAPEQLRIQLLLRLSLNFAMLAEDGREGEAKEKERMHAAAMAAVVCGIWKDRTELGLSPRAPAPRFSGVNENTAWHEYRVRKDDLPKLYRALRIPSKVRIRNGCVFHRENALLLLLRHMRYVTLGFHLITHVAPAHKKHTAIHGRIMRVLVRTNFHMKIP